MPVFFFCGETGKILFRPRFTSAASPAQRVAAESEEIPCLTKKSRRKRGFVLNREFLSCTKARKILSQPKDLQKTKPNPLTLGFGLEMSHSRMSAR